VPDLDGIDAMPAGAFALREQEIDRCRSGAAARFRRRIAKRLAKMTAFGCGFKSNRRMTSGAERMRMGIPCKKTSQDDNVKVSTVHSPQR
jgi:hypothetical protein